MPASAEGIIIIGAGDHGRGTLEILHAARQSRRIPDVLGFLDDSPPRQGTTVVGVPVLGPIDWIGAHHRPGFRYIIGIADSRAKKAIDTRLQPFAVEYAIALHPSANVGRGVSILPGAIINAGVSIAYDASIGAHTTVNLNATIGHDSVIGTYSTVAPGANVAGRVVIGEGCDVSLNVAIGKGLSVGAWTRIAPGTVILRDVPAGAYVFGNPARLLDSHATGALIGG